MKKTKQRWLAPLYSLVLVLVCCLLSGISAVSIRATEVSAEGDMKFVVGFDAEFPPYGYQDENGEYVGFDLDLAQEVCNRRGWKLVKQPINWDSKDMELSSGNIQCIWNGFTMNGREDKYTWSVPYVDNSQVVIVKSGSGIKKLEDLEQKVVAVQSDSSALAALAGEDASKENLELASTFAALQEIADYNSAFMNLEAGAVDAICMDIGVATYEIEARGDKFTMLDEHVSTEQYGIGFKLGNTELRDVVQDTLLEMLDDGTFNEIAKEWGLEDCVCLSHEEVGAEATPIPVSTVEKKSQGNKIVHTIKMLGRGMGDTLIIFFLTLLFSMPLGLLVTFGRKSRFSAVRWIFKIYISIMRGTPLMLQLLVVCFGPYYLFGIVMPSSYRFLSVIIGFSLNYAAYFGEIYRSGIEGVPKGQFEAASVLGYTKTQTFWKIIFPQMCRRVIPPVTNEIITLVKDTSLAFALAYTEMFTVAKQISASQASMVPLFTAGIFYYVFNFLVAVVMERVEKKLSYY